MPKASSRRGFRMAVSGSVLEILIYEDIGEDYWSYEGGITTATIAAKLKAAGSFDSISVRINSRGGSCFDGIGIYNLLRKQAQDGKTIEVHIDALAASAASIIAMAGDTITVGTGAMLMIHNASTFCYGEASALRKMADDLEAISVTAGEIYVKRTGQDAAKIKELMDAETWMNGSTAIELGFATALVEMEPEETAKARALAREFDFRAFRHPQRSLSQGSHTPVKAVTDCECDCGPCVDGDCEACSHDDCACVGCTCPQHQEMAAAVDPWLAYFRHRLALFER